MQYADYVFSNILSGKILISSDIIAFSPDLSESRTLVLLRCLVEMSLNLFAKVREL